MEITEKISLDFFGLILFEPMTVLTDLILFLICLFFTSELHKNTTLKIVNRWKLFFVFIGISTFLGAVTHGLFHYPEGRIFLSVYLSMHIASGYAVYFAESATIHLFASNKSKALLKKLIVLKLFLMIIATLYFQNFMVVVINTALGFLSIIWFKTIKYFKGHIGSGFISTGIIFAILTGIIHGNKISLHAWLNHNDISHFILMISLSLIFIGVRKTKLELEETERRSK